jgi:hypothetical protein
MTEKPKFNEGWGPALEGEEWKLYKEKQFQHLTHHQKFLSIYSSLKRSDFSPELISLIDAANRTIETGNELLGHMSFVRVEREKEKKKSTRGITKGSSHSKWLYAEKNILKVLAEYLSTENQMKSRAEKLTQNKAIEKIEALNNDSETIGESTFTGWLTKYKSNQGNFIFNKYQ